MSKITDTEKQLALTLAAHIASTQPKANKDKKYWFDLYDECLQHISKQPATPLAAKQAKAQEWTDEEKKQRTKDRVKKYS